MKFVTISAYRNEGGKKVFCGSRDVEKPETLAELTSSKSEEHILKQYWKSEAIDVQARIRSGAEEPTPVKVFKGLSPEKQAELLEFAKANGFEIS